MCFLSVPTAERAELIWARRTVRMSTPATAERRMSMSLSPSRGLSAERKALGRRETSAPTRSSNQSVTSIPPTFLSSNTAASSDSTSAPCASGAALLSAVVSFTPSRMAPSSVTRMASSDWTRLPMTSRALWSAEALAALTVLGEGVPGAEGVDTSFSRLARSVGSRKARRHTRASDAAWAESAKSVSIRPSMAWATSDDDACPPKSKGRDDARSCEVMGTRTMYDSSPSGARGWESAAPTSSSSRRRRVARLAKTAEASCGVLL